MQQVHSMLNYVSMINPARGHLQLSRSVVVTVLCWIHSGDFCWSGFRIERWVVARWLDKKKKRKKKKKKKKKEATGGIVPARTPILLFSFSLFYEAEHRGCGVETGGRREAKARFLCRSQPAKFHTFSFLPLYCILWRNSADIAASPLALFRCPSLGEADCSVPSPVSFPLSSLLPLRSFTLHNPYWLFSHCCIS